MCPAKPSRAYLYVRTSATGPRGIRHHVLGWLSARGCVIHPLAGHESLMLFELLQDLRLKSQHVDMNVVNFSSSNSRGREP